jgi:hypothetical protein
LIAYADTGFLVSRFMARIATQLWPLAWLSIYGSGDYSIQSDGTLKAISASPVATPQLPTSMVFLDTIQ